MVIDERFTANNASNTKNPFVLLKNFCKFGDYRICEYVIGQVKTNNSLLMRIVRVSSQTILPLLAVATIAMNLRNHVLASSDTH